MARASATFIRSPWEKPPIRDAFEPKLLENVPHLHVQHLWRDPLQPAEVRDVLARREAVVESLVIEQRADVPSSFERISRAGTDEDGPAIGGKQPADEGERRGFAGTVLTEDAGN
jgi:hypothetical protein